MLSFTYIFILSLAVEMVKRGDESLEERYQLFVRRKEIVLEEMRQLEKQLEIMKESVSEYVIDMDLIVSTEILKKTGIRLKGI